MKYKAKDLRNWTVDVYVNDNWIPARPLSYGGLWGLIQRIKYAWFVLIGKYDVLDWEDYRG